ncbi:MAG: hypothetical protein HYY25_07150 [Candidatus Wallbacteria bacterium]|nr:hypothetical protein [Candidatus Wallbacteria bacterium]
MISLQGWIKSISAGGLAVAVLLVLSSPGVAFGQPVQAEATLALQSGLTTNVDGTVDMNVVLTNTGTAPKIGVITFSIQSSSAATPVINTVSAPVTPGAATTAAGKAVAANFLAGGKLTLNISGGATALGNGVLATVRIKGLAEETANLTLTVDSASDNTDNANDLTGFVLHSTTVQVNAVPVAPTVTAISLSPGATITNTDAVATITVTFSTDVATTPAPTIVFSPRTGTTNTLAGGNLTQAGSARIWRFSTAALKFSNSGSYDLRFTAANFQDTKLTLSSSTALTVTPNILTVNIAAPPCSTTPVATVTLSSTNFVAKGTLTGTINISGLCTGGSVKSGATVDFQAVSGSGGLAASGIALSGSGTTRTFTKQITDSAGANGTYRIVPHVQDSINNNEATVSGNSQTQVVVNIPNLPVIARARITAPAANATLDPGVVTLDGSGSEGTTFTWAKTSGSNEASPGFFTSTSSSKTAKFNARTAGSYTFTLSANSTGSSSSAAVTFNVRNARPEANAGTDVTVRRPDAGTNRNIELNGTFSSDANLDSLAFTWSLTAGGTNAGATLTNANTATPTLVVPGSISPARFDVQLSVSDGNTSDTDNVNIWLTKTSVPVANAGLDTTIVTTGGPLLVPLIGRDSADPDDKTGANLTFQWTQESTNTGRTVQIQNGTQKDATATIAGTSVSGTYVFKLTVTKNNSAALRSVARVSVTVIQRTATQKFPQASFTMSSGSSSSSVNLRGNPSLSLDATPTALPTVQLNATASKNGAGVANTGLTFEWFSVSDFDTSASASAENSFSSTTAASPTFTPPGFGTFPILVRVKDGATGLTAALKGSLSVRKTGTTALGVPAVTITTGAGTPAISPGSGAVVITTATAATLSVNLTAAATGATQFTWFQLTRDGENARLEAEGVPAADRPRLNRATNNTALDAFGGGPKTGASISFGLAPASGLNANAVSGDYSFLVVARNADGVSSRAVVILPVVDARSGKGPLRASIGGLTPVFTEDGLFFSLGALTATDGTFSIRLGDFFDRVRNQTIRQRLSTSAGRTAFKGYIQWAQVAGSADFTTQFDTINAKSNTDITKYDISLTLPTGVSSADFLISYVVDQGEDASNGSMGGVSTSSSSSGTGGATGSDGGGLCALRGDAPVTSVDFLLLLPFGFALLRRNRGLQESHR